MPLFSVYAGEPVYETIVTFQNFKWGTSQEEFIKRMGEPISREEQDGLASLVWEDVPMNGYRTYMLAYFTKAGLQGGTYYFLTYNMDELARCYTEVRQELRDRYGPTNLYYGGVLRELRHYECLWDLSGGYVHLKTNTRQGEPVTLLYLSPEMAKQIIGEKPVTAKK